MLRKARALWLAAATRRGVASPTCERRPGSRQSRGRGAGFTTPGPSAERL